MYDIVYADPPWNESGGGIPKELRTKETDDGRVGGYGRRGANRHYPLMRTQQIIDLPVPELINDNAHLYLWVTNNHLCDGLRVMQAWGFEYKTTITWVKDRFGLGQYFRGQTEHCLFGVRGSIPYKVVGGKRQQGTTVFSAPRSIHSEKPDEMRRLIELVSDRPGFRKLELFARQPAPGWDVWGNEVACSVDLAA